MDPFTNRIQLKVIGPRKPGPTNKSRRKKPPSDVPGNTREQPAGIALPAIIEVASEPGERQRNWTDMNPPFDQHSALRIIHAGTAENGDMKDVYDFYVNVDNIFLKTEQKGSKEDPKLLKAKFTYGLVLIGLAIINAANEQKQTVGTTAPKLETIVEQVTEAVATVLVPMINELGALELNEE